MQPFSLRLAAACALSALVAACGGGDDAPPDPLASYRAQVLDWQACDTTILGTDMPAGAALMWQELGDRLQCAWMRAPMDWGAPQKGDVSVALLRVRSADAAQRRGSLLFNPGGPGGDGLNMPFVLRGAFAQSNPDSPLGARQLRLLDTYDMVGFSPRGVGASTRLQCASNEFSRSHSTAYADLSDATLADNRYNDELLARACARNPLTPYINTDATARDMDLMRHLLGDDKLNFIGYSYGTWLGAWYASLYPERVGRMVLDSSMDFGSPMEESNDATVIAVDRVYKQVLLPYAARHDDVFRLGADPQAMVATWMQWPPRLQGVVTEKLTKLAYSSRFADASLHAFAAAQGMAEVLAAAAPDASAETLKQAVRAHHYTPEHPEVRMLALDMFETYAKTWLDPEVESFSETDIYWAVTCNDDVSIGDRAAWDRQTWAVARQFPLSFGVRMSNPCLSWGGPSVRKPPIAAMRGANVLMVQSQYDIATPADGATPSFGADQFFAKLPAAQRVYVPGEYTHGLYPYKDQCLDGAVTGYLLGEPLMQRELQCQAHPLPEDEKSVQGSQKSGAAPASNYLDAQKADAWLDFYKDRIQSARPRS
ncbi:alpha/beta fold hydrolase [Comamonas sp. NLF-1-9]|uniref:alpha/beta fold hydrolase n=1 Tax=Comamonas sp. NLF-1-9 TaxID=2853163 RepID=UPI001C457CA9|nr:alpha/beta fold hydrolase [Comamonas sp. NLF-1-9]QXL83849.1 alpha/beta hydrolase [Comamonas sp. NLF-1-9]